MKTVLVNLTPHPVVLMADDCVTVLQTIPSSGKAEVERRPGATEQLDGVPVPVVGAPTYGQVTGLPSRDEVAAWVDADPQSMPVYIVSSVVAAQPDVKGRPDVVVPDLQVRDAKGNTIGCRRLMRA